MKRTFTGIAAVLSIGWVISFSQVTQAATSGLDFAGGCPGSETTSTGLCDQGGNADVTNVAAILGVNETLVTQIGEITGFTGSSYGFTIDSADGGQSGVWTVTDSSITHLAFKAGTYFILAKVTMGTGTWDMDPATWDLSLVLCPATICTVNPGPRTYVAGDFLNGGGQIADLSNVRAFSVVPVPAAFWLFGSGLLGLIGISRRKKAA